MIGQQKLLSKLNRLDLNTFPNSLILLGESGCGKHVFCDEIRNKFNNVDIKYVTDKITYDFVESCYLTVLPTFYVLDASLLSVREQNIILKLFEEPPQNIKLIILTTNLAGLLNTVVNRAVIWQFDSYKKEELMQFITDDDVILLDYARTPGQVLGLDKDVLHSMTDLAKLMIEKITRASVSNVLSICDKMKFKNSDSNDKFDLIVFMRVLKTVLVQKILTDSSPALINAFKVVVNYNRSMEIATLNKKYSFEKFLLDFKVSLL